LNELTTMKEQAGKEYYKEYFAATEPMYLKPREFKILNRVGPPFVNFKKENCEQLLS
jgi:hypothetical protein